MNIINSMVRSLLNNTVYAFCHRCLSCGWKKRFRYMKSPDLCYECAGEHPPKREKPACKALA